MTRLTLAVLLLALAAACCCTQAVAADEPATDQVTAPAEPTPALREFFGDDTGKTLDSSARATVQSRSGEAWKIWTGEDAIPETTSSVDAPVIF